MKTKKKLLISLVALVFTIALATSTTFAWFTMNDKVTVGPTDVEVTTGSEGLFFSVDSAAATRTYGTDLTAAQIKALYENGAFDKGYTAVTSADGKTFYKQGSFATADVKTPNAETFDVKAGDYVQGTAATANVNTNTTDEGEYISFRIYFRSTAAMDIYLDGSAYTGATDGGRSKATDVYPAEAKADNGNPLSAWEEYTKGAYSTYQDETETADKALDFVASVKGKPLNARAANAARMSFLGYEYTAADTLATDPIVKVWNPNADNGYNTDTITDATAPKNMSFDYMKKFLGNDSLKTPATSTGLTTKKASFLPTTVDGDALLKTDLTTAEATKVLVSTKANGAFFEAELVINVWLEGWDGDSMSDIYQDKFNFALSFVGVKTTTP